MVLRRGLLVSMLILGVSVAVSSAGCKKNPSNPNSELVLVAMPPFDLNADGTIKDEGLKRIEEQAGSDKGIAVGFSRAALTDAGLIQLSKFKNLRRVEALGSRITPAGIDKLKKAVPEVEVVK